MKTEKQRLTRITSTVRDKFPDDNDIFGYNGITKASIIHSLENSYIFLGLLETIDNEIEIVWIKRKLAKYFDELSEILKEFNTETWIQKFDHFLDIVFEMRINLKELYTRLVRQPEK